ncbi:MAG TPA: M3 family metallopeptidase, partial [Polyangiaceae bacterium]|nr:M3 family metallopeptidase [Polyangiaceae bacterium]
MGNTPLVDAKVGANPLLAAWSGPYGGAPPFARVEVSHFEPALEAAMNENRGEIARIVDNPEAPTFENTFAALEDASRTLHRAGTIYDIWSGTMNGPEFQMVERKVAPKMAAFFDEVMQNEKLWKRIEAVYASPQTGLTPEQRRLVWRTYTNFARAGAKLDGAAKKRMAEINQRLATLYTTFNQNVLADEESYAVVLESDADVAGLPELERAGAKAAAEARGLAGKWAITNTRSSVEPFLAYSSREDLRQKVWQNFIKRGDNGDAHDNNAVISEILRLRAERAKLLGYPTYAHWQLENTMAKTPERAVALMEAVWAPAVARVRQEVADMLAVANQEAGKTGLAPKTKIEPWDYRYYAEKVRKAKYDLDENEVKPYLQLEKLREAMFWVAGELFGFSFAPISDVEVYQEDMRVWAV